jgi:hypothetical protein
VGYPTPLTSLGNVGHIVDLRPKELLDALHPPDGNLRGRLETRYGKRKIQGFSHPGTPFLDGLLRYSPWPGLIRLIPRRKRNPARTDGNDVVEKLRNGLKTGA